MAKVEVKNLHILGYFNERISDVTKLDQLLRYQREESGDIKVSSKRKIALISTKKRTSSFMRYKLPRLKKHRKNNINKTDDDKDNSSNFRRQRRYRTVLSKIHSIPELEKINNSGGNICRWSELHFWNKKRFKTKTCWGYSLPIYHQGRGKKFLHAAIQNDTVIHDSSYIRPLQIIGFFEHIQQLLGCFTVSLC